MYFRVFGFQKDKRYIELGNSKEPQKAIALAMEKSKDYHRVIITDSGDCIVFEVIEQKVVFPPQNMQ